MKNGKVRKVVVVFASAGIFEGAIKFARSIMLANGYLVRRPLCSVVFEDDGIVKASFEFNDVWDRLAIRAYHAALIDYCSIYKS